MIAEAVDAATTLGLALVLWVLLLAAALTAALYTLVVTAAVAWLAVTRGIAACMAAVQGARHLPTELPIPALIASRRRPQPSWALPDNLEAPNASRSPESEKEPIA